jgi:uncharacterized membrane protein
MERMLAIVFDDEAKAYEGSRALNELDAEGSIAIHAVTVAKKNADGTLKTEDADGDYPIRTLEGTALGSLIGLLGGPVGMGIGAVAGAWTGMFGDLFVAGVDTGFLSDVGTSLTPGKCAVVADVSEEWVTPVDTRMEALGGVVFRAARKHVEADQRASDAAELRSEIDQLKTEQAKSRADAKAKIQKKIDQLNDKLRAQLDQARQRSDEIQDESEAKIDALQKKAAKAQGDRKAAFNARVAEIRENYEQATSKLRVLASGKLRSAADQLEKAG